MKIKLLLFFLLVSSSSFAFLIADEKKINIATEKYQYGYYDECLLILNKFTDAGYFSKNPLQASDAFALKAASHFRLADYKLYNKSISAWQGLSNGNLSDSVKLICRFKLAQLYLEVGNIKACDSLLTSFSENLNPAFTSALMIVKASLLLEQGYITKAGQILSQKATERKEMLVKGASKDIYFALLNNNKKIYMDIVCRGIRMAIVQGKIDSADAVITLHKEWLNRNFQEAYYYRELDRLLGEVQMSGNNISEAYDFFKKAYEYDNFSDQDYKKTELLSSVIILSNRLGYIDQSQKMLRRLQMLASISAGKQEPFQYIYERTLIQFAAEENNFSDAAGRLKSYSNVYGMLPSWHPLKLSFAKLESDLLLYKKGFNVTAGLDSLILLYQQLLGESHEYVARLLVEKISYEIYFGSTVKNTGKDLERLNNIFISKGHEGNYLLQYLELSGTYYLLFNDFKLSKEYAEKAYNYSVKLYGVNSEKIIYYRAVFLESLLHASAYKEFYKQFDELKKTFSATSWQDMEEKRKSYLAISAIYKLIGEADDNKGELIKIVSEMDESAKENIYAKSKTESQLAFIYYQTGNLFKGEKLINKSIDAKKSLLPGTSVAFIEDLFFLSELELQKGNFKETEKYLEQASLIISGAYGKDNLLYVEYLKLHADYCIVIGDYKRADEYINQSQKIVLEKFGKEDLSNVSLLVRKAFILAQNDRNKIDEPKIISLYDESLSILSKTIGKENVLYMDVLKKNARFLIATNKLNKADSLLTVVETYWKKRLGNENRELLEVFLLKGDISYEKNEYEKANSHYGNVKSIASSIYDTKNSYYTRAYARQAKVSYMQNKHGDALSIMEDLLPKYLDFVSKNFPAMSFREKAKYWNNMRDEFEFYVFLVLNDKELTTKYSKEVYNNVIATKAILLSNNIKIRENIMASKDSVLIQSYNDWINLKEYYTSVSSLTKAEQEEQKIDLRSIESEIEKKERNLSNRSESFKTEDKISNASLKDVAAVLSEKEYAVEMVRYRNFYKKFTDTINYAALVVKKDAVAPEVVIFPGGNHFESSGLKYARNAARFHLKDKSSYNLFWTPLQNQIPEGSTVYLSAEGAFNQFNLEMLADSNGKYILDMIELVQVTNTKELLRLVYQSDKKKAAASSEVVLCGSPVFYVNGNSNYTTRVDDLPGAAKEVSDLSGLLVSGQSKVITMMGKDLTEEWVKGLNSPKIFHIATHGYYSEVKNNEEENNAMLNSGLMLYGSGDIIGSESHVNSKDGVLTAYEAMNLKFDHTDLVVLSACETGLGEVKAGEGVYGLQRSFLIAGSKTIILSLYKVNDEVTQKLMMEFYSQWMKTGDIRGSFISAKQKIKSEYPDMPIYWGAFVLIEGQPQLKKDRS